jgi:transcriptional regulator of acetoin/glycerol metabolism
MPSPQVDHAARVHAMLARPDAAARSAVAASWRRSIALHGLDPADASAPPALSDTAWREARARAEPMARAAAQTLDRLFQVVGGAGCCVLPTDARGVPVDRRSAAGDDDDFRRAGLWVGADWSETAVGTNGIGTALAERRALTIHKDQHFRARDTALSCTAAPIHDGHGQLAGALDVSSARADLTAGVAGLIAAAVADAARRIETALFRDAFPKARVMLGPEGAGGVSLLAVDGDDLVIGATRAARLALGLSNDRLGAGLTVSRALGAPADDGLAQAQRAALHRALAEAGGNVSQAARALGLSRATMHRKMAAFGLARR